VSYIPSHLGLLFKLYLVVFILPVFIFVRLYRYFSFFYKSKPMHVLFTIFKTMFFPYMPNLLTQAIITSFLTITLASWLAHCSFQTLPVSSAPSTNCCQMISTALIMSLPCLSVLMAMGCTFLRVIPITPFFYTLYHITAKLAYVMYLKHFKALWDYIL
jgi:hypothetical protein